MVNKGVHIGDSGYLKMNRITAQNVIVDNANERIKLLPVTARRIKYQMLILMLKFQTADVKCISLLYVKCKSIV